MPRSQRGVLPLDQSHHMRCRSLHQKTEDIFFHVCPPSEYWDPGMIKRVYLRFILPGFSSRGFRLSEYEGALKKERSNALICVCFLFSGFSLSIVFLLSILVQSGRAGSNRHAFQPQFLRLLCLPVSSHPVMAPSTGLEPVPSG